SFLNATPYNQAFKDSMFMVKDFWAIPEFGDLLESPQRNWSRFIVEDKGTAKQAMDNISKDWQKIFKKYGYR
ncbi:MAG: carbohydrate ABC transporter substrate-binding protein, partial [Deltaproteobacteria bacterium]|nr:carbohydrate ABC transporter substrate-binding protein [Deltaproteobacteria bacterium]